MKFDIRLFGVLLGQEIRLLYIPIKYDVNNQIGTEAGMSRSAWSTRIMNEIPASGYLGDSEAFKLKLLSTYNLRFT